MRKKSFLSITLLFLSFSLFAESLYTLSTEHFDLIYPEACQETALILYENVEALYKKATDLLQSDEELFIPVYITPDNQQLNAYYTPFPYNRIVYYDTPVDSFSMSVFSETKLSIFYHELVHAVSMNIRDGFWSFLSSFMGDCYSPSYLFTSTLSFLEGVTVSFESMDGEGRLNNGDHMAFLVQAKLEDKFPSWKDASGPRDIFPSSYYAYLFGGAFNRYIQNKYGMDKYAEFWKKCGSVDLFSLFVDASFKEVYGHTLDEEWTLFEESIPLPAISESLVNTIQKKPAYISSLAFRNGAEKGIAFLENASYISYLPLDPSTGLPGDVEHLLLADGGVSQLAFSDDGRYLLITGLGTKLPNSYSLKIYDMKAERYVSDELSLLSSSCLAKIPELGDFIISNTIRSGRSYLEIRDFEEIKDKGNSSSVLFSELLPVSTELYSLVAVDDQLFSLEKIHGEWKLSVYDFMSEGSNCYLEKSREYSFPEGLIPSSFSYGGEENGNIVFYSSVAGRGLSAGRELLPGSLSRLMIMELPSDGEGAVRMTLGRDDVSGGVHEPYYFADADMLYFLARKAEYIQFSYTAGIPGACTEIGFMQPEAVKEAFSDSQQLLSDEASQVLAQRESYNALKYLLPGTFLPLGEDWTSENLYLPGVTWSLVDPTEQLIFLLSGGWDFLNQKGGISLRSWGGPSFLSYDASLLAEFNTTGFNRSEEKLILSGSFPLWTRRQEIKYTNTTDHIFYNSLSQFLYNNFDLSYTTVYKSGIGLYDRWFFSAGASLTTECTFIPNLEPKCYNNVGFRISGGTGGFVPLSFSASFMKNSISFMELDASALLFSWEIQKGIPFFPLYANRFTISAGYKADWVTMPRNMFILDFPVLMTDLSSFFVKHGVKCGINFTLSPTPSLTYSYQFKLGADFIWYFENEQNSKLYDLVLCGVFTF